MQRIAVLLLTTCIAPIACVERQPLPAAEPAPPLPFHDLAFADTLDLLRAIETGTFAERAGLDDELATATIPDPVTIEFVSGSRVPSDQEPELRELARLLGADDRLALDLVGCSDPPGSEDLNLRISQRRAEAVAQRLRELGVAEEQIAGVVGRGEDCEVQERAVRAIPALRESALSRDGESDPRAGARLSFRSRIPGRGAAGPPTARSTPSPPPRRT